MNGVETRSPKVEGFSQPQEERISKKRRKRKLRRIKNSIILFLCTIIIITCLCLIAYLINKGLADVKTSGVFPDKQSEQILSENEYASFPYYKEEYQNRYEEYARENPTLEPADVVWMVNANQDKEKYNYDIAVSGYDDVKIIVNKYYKVPDDYVPSDLVSVDGQRLRAEAATAFKKMRNEASGKGLKIRAVSGYRTVEYQRGLYNRYLSSDSQENVDRYSARPGYSEHHTGLAVDVFGSTDGLRQFVNTPEFPWVRDNCYKYGFIIRYLEETEEITGYESEPWHLRYVGVDVSTDMKEKGINNFEEYHAKYLQ